ncbi:MAG: hypothetical protein PHR94_04990 [Methylomonas lenta]|nr:hypothetical protein [Methylomonas lenta]
MTIEKAQACLGFFMLKPYPIQCLASDTIDLIAQTKAITQQKSFVKNTEYSK